VVGHKLPLSKWVFCASSEISADSDHLRALDFSAILSTLLITMYYKGKERRRRLLGLQPPPVFPLHPSARLPFLEAACDGMLCDKTSSEQEKETSKFLLAIFSCRYTELSPANSKIRDREIKALCAFFVPNESPKYDTRIASGPIVEFKFADGILADVVLILNRMARVVLDDHLAGYIFYNLKQLERFKVWRNSKFAKMTYTDLDDIICRHDIAEEQRHEFNHTLRLASEKLDIGVPSLESWISLAAVSKYDKTRKPESISDIQDRDFHYAAKKILDDIIDLDTLKDFGISSLPIYRAALDAFRDEWFVSIKRYWCVYQPFEEQFDYELTKKGDAWREEGKSWGDGRLY
jgi:hypothetical protein